MIVSADLTGGESAGARFSLPLGSNALVGILGDVGT